MKKISNKLIFGKTWNYWIWKNWKKISKNDEGIWIKISLLRYN